MSTVFEAARAGNGYVPAFTVTKLDGQFEKTISSKEKDSMGIGFKTVMADQGWLVEFPSHPSHARPSIHVETMAEMRRLGFDRTTVPLIDVKGDGDVVGEVPNVIRKREREKVNA